VVSFTPRPIYRHEKRPWYPLDRRLDVSQNRSGRGCEEKNSQPLLGLKPSILQPIGQSYTTELSRLLLSSYIVYRTCWNRKKYVYSLMGTQVLDPWYMCAISSCIINRNRHDKFQCIPLRIRFHAFLNTLENIQSFTVQCPN
jgi:hypothetical protein